MFPVASCPIRSYDDNREYNIKEDRKTESDMLWEIEIAARAEDTGVQLGLSLMDTVLPLADKIIWKSPAALLWVQLYEESLFAEEKTAARILRQVLPLCRKDEAYYKENAPVVGELAKLVYGRNFKVLPFTQKLDIRREIRRFAGEAAEHYAAVLGQGNCDRLRQLTESKLLHLQHFEQELGEDADYTVLWEQTMQCQMQKLSGTLLMESRDMAFWQQQGGEFSPVSVELPAFAPVSAEERCTLHTGLAASISECRDAAKTLKNAADQTADAAWQMLAASLTALARECPRQGVGILSARCLKLPKAGNRLALILESECPNGAGKRPLHDKSKI